MEIALSKEDKSEILRYLEYRKHDIDENLDKQLDRCMDLINKAARPKYITKVVDISEGIPKDCTFIKGFDLSAPPRTWSPVNSRQVLWSPP